MPKTVVNVTFTSHLRQHCRAAERRVEPGPLSAVLAAVFRDEPVLRSYILDDQGAVRKHVTIFINSQSISDRECLTDPVPDGAEVYVAQALSGG